MAMQRVQRHGKRQGPRTALGERDPPIDPMEQRPSSHSEAALADLLRSTLEARCRGRGTLHNPTGGGQLDAAAGAFLCFFFFRIRDPIQIRAVTGQHQNPQGRFGMC